jgi:hypothetical protein
MRRATIGLVVLALVVGTALVATGRTGPLASRTLSEGDSDGQRNAFVRWDLVQFPGGVIAVGGTDVSTDTETGDTVDLTGSGQAEPAEGEAAGGGTFVHRNAAGATLAEGAYYVIHFVSWRRLAGGSLDATGLIDGIGNGPGANPNEHEPTSGVLKLRVHFVPVVDGTPQPGVNGLLIIYCHLPGTFEFVPEGVQVKVPSFGLNFKPTSGNTLFHGLR